MSARQTSRATASAPNPAQAIGRLTKDRRTPLNGLKGRNNPRNQGCGWRRALVSCSSLRTELGQSVSADESSVPQSSAIGGLSTSGGCVSASSAPNASHSAATASGDRRPSSAIAATVVTSPITSSGRASQVSLQREQRTVLPESPRLAG